VRSVAERVATKALISSITRKCDRDRPPGHLAHIPGGYRARVRDRLVEVPGNFVKDVGRTRMHDELVVIRLQVRRDDSGSLEFIELRVVEPD